MLAQDISGIEHSAEQSEEDARDGKSEAPGNRREPSESDEDEDEEEVEAEAKSTSPESQSAIASSAEGSHAEVVEPETAPAARGDDRRVEPTAEVDPLSQEHPAAPVEELEHEGPEDAKQHPNGVDAADISAKVSEADDNDPEPIARTESAGDDA